MSDSPRAKAAAAIRNARAPAVMGANLMARSAMSVTVKNVTFTLDEAQARRLEEVNADTERAIDPGLAS